MDWEVSAHVRQFLTRTVFGLAVACGAIVTLRVLLSDLEARTGVSMSQTEFALLVARSDANAAEVPQFVAHTGLLPMPREGANQRHPSPRDLPTKALLAKAHRPTVTAATWRENQVLPIGIRTELGSAEPFFFYGYSSWAERQGPRLTFRDLVVDQGESNSLAAEPILSMRPKRFDGQN